MKDMRAWPAQAYSHSLSTSSNTTTASAWQLTASMKQALSCFSVQAGGMLRTDSRVSDTTKLGLFSFSFFSSAGAGHARTREMA